MEAMLRALVAVILAASFSIWSGLPLVLSAILTLSVGFAAALWGDLPDQYGRRWDNDDGESPEPKRPTRLLTDLPPILPRWGPRQRS